MRKLIIVLMVLMLPSMACAMNVTLSGVDVTVNYTEPTDNTDGSVLIDLDRTEITNSFNSDKVTVPATIISGGGNVSQVISIPITAGQEADVQIDVVACDTSDNCSTPTSKTVRIDRLSPSPVQ